MGILLAVLRTVGIILLILLLIVLLLLLLLLFVPFRYRIRGGKEEGAGGGTLRVSWLFHMLELEAEAGYRSGDGLSVGKDIRIFGLSLIKLLNELKDNDKDDYTPYAALDLTEGQGSAELGEIISSEESGHEAENAAEVQVGEASASESGPAAETDTVSAENEDQASAEIGQEMNSGRSQGEQIGDYLSALAGMAREYLDAAVRRIQDGFLSGSGRVVRFCVSLFFRAAGLIWRAFCLLFRLLGLPGRLEALRAELVGKALRLLRLARRWKSFLFDDRTRGALVFLKKTAGKLLRHVLPRKLKGDLTLGFEDPSLTGNVMAVKSAIYPLIKPADFTIRPYFNGARFEGEIDAGGRVYLFYLAYLTITTILNKNIRYVISNLKHMKEED
ncbi:MAG: DUF2953 domain-containing protein [Lachnospiraceae bacterium]|nr:DUF2953 domain-containing protein [Lachnospiraceae bacterium]